MRLSQTDLAQIVARNDGFAERLREKGSAEGVDSATGTRRLRRWKELAADSDPERFAEHLDIHGLRQVTDEDLCARLGAANRPPNGPLPPWASFLGQIADAISQSAGYLRLESEPTRRQRKSGRVPYEHLYWPIAEFAWGQVESIRSHLACWPYRKAKLALQVHLLERLSTLFSSTLHAAFLAQRMFRVFGMMKPAMFGTAPDETIGSEQRFYHEFVTEHSRDGLRSLFLRYPVAARLIAQVTMFWIEFVQEFLQRFDNDRHKIAVQFNHGAPIGQLLSIRAGVSDPHHEGRSVLILGFRGGLKLVYKPRPLAVDHLFFSLIKELNARASRPGLRVLDVMDRGPYGWMEFARPASCRDQEAVARYYHRAGFMAGLIHWLQGIDFHRENVVASGEHPVLVDLEALAHSPRPEERSVVTDASTLGRFADSVLRTGLLPLRQTRDQGSIHYDLSGFGAPVKAPGLIASCRWKNVNTDRMERMSVKHRRMHGAHRARLNNRLLSIRSHEREVMRGYRQLAKVLGGDHHNDFIAWRNRILRAPRRRIKRPTVIYGLLLQASLESKCLMDGIDRSIELMALPLAAGEETEWKREIASLEKLDVPYFQQQVDAELGTSGPFQQSSRSDLLDQATIIKLALRHRLCLHAGTIRKMSDSRERRAAKNPLPNRGG